MPCPDRRDFLKSTAAATAAVLPGTTLAQADQEKELIIVDCHAHIYGTPKQEKQYPTIAKPLRPPKGTGTIAHLQREMKANNIDMVTAIQTSSYYKFDNRFTADSARRHRGYLAGVVTLDPDEPQSPWVMEYLVEKSNVKGMRSIAAKSGRMDDPGVDRLWATAERLGIVINSLTGRGLKSQVATLCARHPKLRVVIDHCLNIRANDELDATVADMQELAKLPNVHAKLTFIATGTRLGYPGKDLHAACHEVIKAFGPERCVWGSDFPCELWCKDTKFSYAQHLRVFTEELGLDAKSKREILGRTALRLWWSWGRKGR